MPTDKTSADLKDAEAWTHHEIDLNELGRVTKLPEPAEESEEALPPEYEVEGIEPHAPIKPEAWSIRMCPDGAGAAATSLVIARSLTFPGAIAISNGKRFLTMYAGNGIANEGPAPYTPPMPAPIAQEWAPAADDEGALQLLEQEDMRVDPTPPQEEEEEEEG
jgi:radial spoke head protein 4A